MQEMTIGLPGGMVPLSFEISGMIDSAPSRVSRQVLLFRMYESTPRLLAAVARFLEFDWPTKAAAVTPPALNARYKSGLELLLEKFGELSRHVRKLLFVSWIRLSGFR